MVYGIEVDGEMALAQFEAADSSDPKAFVLDTIAQLLQALHEPVVEIELTELPPEE